MDEMIWAADKSGATLHAIAHDYPWALRAVFVIVEPVTCYATVVWAAWDIIDKSKNSMAKSDKSKSRRCLDRLLFYHVAI